MTTLILPPAPSPALLPLHHDQAVARAARPQQRCLLVLSDDEEFWQGLLTAGSNGGQKLLREHATAGTPGILLVNPAVVLLDLDLPSAAAWDAADSLVQDSTSPPLLLLTSRNDQPDFQTAIQAGSLIDKSERPARLLELADVTLESATTVQREQSAMQRLVIRWLKPCNRSAQVIPLRRFWGINE